MLISVYRRIFCLSHPLEHSHKKYKAGKCALKTRKGEASPPRLYMLQTDLDKVTPTPPQERVLRHPNSGIRCIYDTPLSEIDHLDTWMFRPIESKHG